MSESATSKTARSCNSPTTTTQKNLDYHRAVISDYWRIKAYRDSIMKSKEQLADKTVLHIGCGTGIFAIFACQAGASNVFAVENSHATRSGYVERVIERNGFKNNVCVVPSRVENFGLPPGEKVDAIIHEWNGYMLLAEWWLPSAISARDRLLKEGGLMFPNKVSTFMALVRETKYIQHQAKYWRHGPKEEYNVNMSVLAKEECKDFFGHIIFHEVDVTDIVSAPCELFSLDLQTVTAEECCPRSTDFQLTASESCDVFGFCIWFKSFFPGDVSLDTSPFSPCTTLMQTVLYAHSGPFHVEQGGVVSGQLTFHRHSIEEWMLHARLEYTLEKRRLVNECCIV